jgi:hypothetical protein
MYCEVPLGTHFTLVMEAVRISQTLANTTYIYMVLLSRNIIYTLWTLLYKKLCRGLIICGFIHIAWSAYTRSYVIKWITRIKTLSWRYTSREKQISCNMFLCFTSYIHHRRKCLRLKLQTLTMKAVDTVHNLWYNEPFWKVEENFFNEKCLYRCCKCVSFKILSSLNAETIGNIQGTNYHFRSMNGVHC